MLNFHTYKRLFCANCDVIAFIYNFRTVDHLLLLQLQVPVLAGTEL